MTMPTSPPTCSSSSSHPARVTRNGLSCSAQGHAEPDGNLAAGHLCRVAHGVLVLPEGAAPLALLAFTVKNGLITRLDVLADRERLAQLDLSSLG